MIPLFLLGDTWRVDIGGGETEWQQVASVSSPSPRYGFVSGVVGNYWIVSHGKWRSVGFRAVPIYSLQSRAS